jgi:DNA-binding NarL/FixJ family response regulator
MLGQSLVDALEGHGVGGARHVTDLAGAQRELSRRPAEVTLAGLEAAPEDVAGLVTELLTAGSRSVVVLAPVVQESDLLAALDAGTLGYVSRDEPLDRLAYDIKGALRGEACLPRDLLAPVLRMLIQRRREEDERSSRLSRLSKREIEVLQHLATGAQNHEIAAELYLSQATVRTHVQNILGKLEVHSRMEAIALAHGDSPEPQAAARKDPS